MWDDFHKARQWGQYPSEHLVRYMLTSFPEREERKTIKVLEIGCGAGANTWFLDREGFDTWGIDISPSAIERAALRVDKHKHKQYRVKSVTSMDKLFDPETFDVVVDICCLQHIENIERAMIVCNEVLKKGGRMYSIMADENHHRDVLPGVFTRFISFPDVCSLFLNYGFNVRVGNAMWTTGPSRKVSQWLIECTKP